MVITVTTLEMEMTRSKQEKQLLIRHPRSDWYNYINNVSIYTVNKIADNMTPCFTPFPIVKQLKNRIAIECLTDSEHNYQIQNEMMIVSFIFIETGALFSPSSKPISHLLISYNN